MLIAVIILGVLLLLVVVLYNKLVKKRMLMQESWSGIDVYLKKRSDLIPNLVETVKGYAGHEKGVLEEVTRYRSSAMQAKSPQEKIDSEKGLTQALNNLLVVSENYPELKANANFQQLQAQLTTMEGELELARRYYNGTVRENNILVEGFPTIIIANLFGFKKGVFFEITNAAEREVPKVVFN